MQLPPYTGQGSERAALIYLHSSDDRQHQIADTLDPRHQRAERPQAVCLLNDLDKADGWDLPGGHRVLLAVLSVGALRLGLNADPFGRCDDCAGRQNASGLDRPACTPSAIRAVLAANADAEVLRRYDADLDVAYEQAREDGDLTPLVQTVRRWWFEADAWRDPEAQREGPPPPEQRITREEIRAQYGV